MMELDTGVAWASLPITRISPQVAPKSKILRLSATLHNTGWMDHCQVRYGHFEVILILDPVDVEEAYSHIAWHYQSVQWHDPSYGCCYASFGWEEDSTGGELLLHREVSSTEAVQILCSSDSNDGNASHFHPDPQSFPDVEIISEVGQGNRYQSWGRDILYFPIQAGRSEVWGEPLLCQPSTCAGGQTRRRSSQQPRPLRNCFRIGSIIPRSLWCGQRW